MSKIDKNVFVSHVHKDDDKVGKLKDLLGKNDYKIRDYSVNKDNPNNAHNEDYIKQQILKPRLDACSVLAVLVTPNTKDSEWVDWEVEYAQKHYKRIVAIWADGCKGTELPDSLKDYTDARVVAWNNDKIIEALNGTDHMEDHAGNRTKARQVKSAKCH